MTQIPNQMLSKSGRRIPVSVRYIWPRQRGSHNEWCSGSCLSGDWSIGYRQAGQDRMAVGGPQGRVLDGSGDLSRSRQGRFFVGGGHGPVHIEFANLVVRHSKKYG
jgi:hypothetical protein